MKWILETKRKKHILTLSLKSFEDSKELWGFTNKCVDSQYITLLDYDHWSKEDVEANLLFLEKKYNIVFHYLFSTGKGYHAISLNKVPFLELRYIMEDSFADPSFVKVPFITTLRSSTLRLSEKDGKLPQLIKQWPFKRCGYEMSQAHFLMLKKAYPGLLKPKGDFDGTGIKDVIFTHYWSKPQ